MSQCIVPNWNLKQQRQDEQVVQAAGGERNICSESDHHLDNNNNSPSINISPMLRTKYEVAELTWENGQLAMHGIGGILPATQTKPICNDTLESIVRHAASTSTSTTQNNKNISLNLLQNHQYYAPPKLTSMVPSISSGGQLQGLPKKRTRADSDKCMQEEMGGRSTSPAWGSASATFRKDKETTIMTWPSYDSPRSFKTKTTDEDSACHGGISESQEEDHQETKLEKGRSHSSRRSRAAAIHNQSERRRRDRINQKMKALQRLVPNANKTDKASMLEEVIDYLKQLQAQVQLMCSVRNVNVPQMMMPLGLPQQHHLQMSLLAARMGMGVGLGMGIGMLDMNTIATAARTASQTLPPLIHPTAPVSATTPTFVPSPFMVPPMISQANPEPADTNASVPLTDPYCAFLAQSMNLDLYNKMAAIYRQQVNQITQQAASSSPSTHTQSNHMQGD